MLPNGEGVTKAVVMREGCQSLTASGMAAKHGPATSISAIGISVKVASERARSLSLGIELGCEKRRRERSAVAH